MTVSSFRSVQRLLRTPYLKSSPTSSLPLVTATRGASQAQEHKIAVVTGASRGIGYATAKELCSRLTSANIYLTTRGQTDDLNALIKQEVGDKGKMVEFHTMEVTDVDSMVEFRNMLRTRHGKIDILINNAGRYFEPSDISCDHHCQVKNTLAINYWGLKNICKAFFPMMNQKARIVNLSSHLGHLSLIPGEAIKTQLGDPHLTEQQLDSLILQYQEHCTALTNTYREVGWPESAYTVSKVAVNAYTRILQRQLEEEGMESVVVNAIHPGSKHSRIVQESALTDADGAKAVVSTAMLADPCYHPRGKFIWHDLKVKNWDQGNVKAMWA
eukprot:GFUD01040432.1.p1 GENE.GFUD01040432.1~~GFUD01040432.1.p1  ORF type:complete len:328 (+),score=51.63 GFUD01040432.1:144-1127(+)